MCDMVSLSDKISARFLVPKTLRNVVAARSLVEWLQIWKDAVGEVEVLSLEPVCCKKQQKKVPDQLQVCGIGDLWRTWMIPNLLYMSPSDSPDHPGSILYRLESSQVPYSANQ